MAVSSEALRQTSTWMFGRIGASGAHTLDAKTSTAIESSFYRASSMRPCTRSDRPHGRCSAPQGLGRCLPRRPWATAQPWARAAARAVRRCGSLRVCGPSMSRIQATIPPAAHPPWPSPTAVECAENMTVSCGHDRMQRDFCGEPDAAGPEPVLPSSARPAWDP